MNIYRVIGNIGGLQKIDPTSFAEEGIHEREDLQRILRDMPDVLEEGLLIIAEEFGDWQDSRRRIDLLGLDDKGRLVVIELKRGDTGEHMDLQAVRYAAMVANMTIESIVETYQTYLDKRAKQDGNSSDEDAAARIREHLGIAEIDSEAIHTDIPRVILVSEDFSKELTTCVMWLNDSWLRSAGQEIKCIKLRPHRNGKEILIEASQVIPLPEATDYQTQLGKRQQETRGPASPRSITTLGGERFKERISAAQEKFQPGLKRLYECASCLEDRRLAKLFTRVNGKGDYVQLQLRSPDGNDSFLVSFNNVGAWER